ncbi:hypothetical protein C367_01135 [Cryptococcus neoformans Ze90-1]|nr:hypothetical protein C367_01135 [Cryptococcus neoformans var. grubii Ze90-1]
MPATRDAPATQARPARSRLDRPCDLCRRHKHLCVIEVRGEPCSSCRARKKSCTFDMPPTARKRKPKAASSVERSTAVTESSRDRAMPDLPATSLDNPIPSFSTQGDVRTGPQAPNTTAPNNQSRIAGSSLGSGTSYGRFGSEGEGLVNDYSAYPSGSRSAVPWHRLQSDLPQHASLDLEEDNDDQEYHFLGADAFSALILKATGSATTSQPSGGLSFRQVSSDPKYPVYFVKHPSLMYGRTSNNGRMVYETILRLCEGVCQDVSLEAASVVRRCTLPALPIINSKRLEDSCMGLEGSGPVPYALLSGIIAHSIHYLPEITPLRKNLWHEALLALDDEYRQPRLSTLQLALLQIYSRPMEIGENSGQITIAIARAIGAAHLLGLHIDPTNWSLPYWETSLRKRIWWALLIQDKWRALLYGRPSYLHHKAYHVSLPTLEDCDAEQHASDSDWTSMETFIATCRLTLIIDDLLENSHSMDSVGRREPSITRIARLEAILKHLDDLKSTLPEDLLRFNVRDTILPTGVRSFQLSYLGLGIIIRRLLIDSLPENAQWQAVAALSEAYQSCQDMLNFISVLVQADQNMYWAPFSAHHISNTVNLLLRIATKSRCGNDESMASQAIAAANDLITALISIYQATSWDTIGGALRRIASLLLFAQHELIEVRMTYDQLATALHIPLSDNILSADNFLTSLGLMSDDALFQTGTDQAWLAGLGLWNSE